MFKHIKNYIPVAAALLSLGMFTACSDDDNVEQDEWTATYVYLQRTDFLESDSKEFSLVHTPLELSGNVNMEFSAKIQKTSSHDISVELGVEGSENLPSTSYRFVDREGNQLASNTLTIKAGQTSSDTIRMVLDDLSPLAGIDGELTEKGCIKIDKVITDTPNTLVATNPKMKQLDFSVVKDKKRYVIMGNVPTGSVQVPLTAEALTVSGANWYTDPKSLVDGKSDSYVLFYGNAEKGIQIDLGEERTVTAIQTDYLYSGYDSSNVTVMCADGDEWKEIGTLDVTGATQIINLLGKPKSRYLYLRLNKWFSAWGYIYMTQLRVYAE